MKRIFITFILATICGISAFAYSFYQVCESGQTLYYTITSSTAPYTVEIVSQNSSSPYYSTYPIGDLVIPSSVTYSGRTYSVTSISEHVFWHWSELTSITIPNSVTSIANSVFSGDNGLTAVVYTGSIEQWCGISFGSNPLRYAHNLYINNNLVTDLVIPNTVAEIKQRAFWGATCLTSVTIPNSVTSIGMYAFDECSNLLSITIGNSVTSIDDYAFGGCSGLTAVFYTGTIAQWCGITFNANPLSNAHNLYINNNLVTDLVIPNTVAEIKQRAFIGATCLTSVTIPNSVTSIGRNAFQGCSGLTSVTIPNSVTSIGWYAFSGCSGLTGELIIPNSVTTIEEKTFQQCSGLTSVTIPNSVTSIGNYAFYGCSGLTGELIIPNSVTTIGRWAFCECSGLTSLTIGNSVTSIGIWAFLNCNGLTDIYANPAIPPSINSGTNPAIQFSTIATRRLWVPCGSAEAYRTATGGWRNCDIRESGAYMLNVSSANRQQGTASITQQPNCTDRNAIIAATPNRGYTFSQWNDGNTDNPRTVTVTADVEYTAYFVSLPSYTITAVSADETLGTVTGGGIFYEGETASLIATANYGYAFGSWTDGNTDNPRTVTVTGNATYTATFVALHTITVRSADTNMGTVSGGGDYAEGSQVEISATPAAHHHFVQWNDGNTDNPRTITVTEDASYIAEFAIDRHNVMVISANETMGGVSEGGTYDYGTEIQISANANDGYAFLSWQDDNTDNPRTITVTGDSIFVASFAEARTVTVEVSNSEMGYAIGSGVYAEGAVIQITAVPYDNYRFDHWVDVENPNRDFNTDNPRTITVTTDVTYMAVFETITSIDENSVSEIALFPNPTTDILNITSSETISEIEIVNVMGQVVKKMYVNSDNAVCDVEDLKAGVYVVRIHAAKSDTSTTLSVRRFVKE